MSAEGFMTRRASSHGRCGANTARLTCSRKLCSSSAPAALASLTTPKTPALTALRSAASVSTAITLVMCVLDSSSRGGSSFYSQCDGEGQGSSEGGGDEEGFLARLQKLLAQQTGSSLPPFSSFSLDSASQAVFVLVESGVPGKLGYGFIMVSLCMLCMRVGMVWRLG